MAELRPSWRTAVPYVAPFAAFIALLGLTNALPVEPALAYPLRTILAAAVLLLFSRGVIPLRATHVLSSIALGAGVFLVWIGPEALWPGYRAHWLFQNTVTGAVPAGAPPMVNTDRAFLFVRIAGSTLLVPLVEELFWRGFLMRSLTGRHFEKVPLGAYTPFAFWMTAALFAAEHGPYWDVGLLAGLAYNWWVVHTRNLGACVIAHAVTNGCLAVYVVWRDQWQYWL